MSRTRRSYLIGFSTGIAALSGCQRIGLGDRETIGIEIANYTADDQPLQLTLLREDEKTYDEAKAMEKEYTVPAPEAGESAGETRKADLVPKRRYLVRVLLKYGDFETFHAHYYPGSSGDGRIQFDIRRDETAGDLFVDFRAL